jgi:hypothetical protein
MVTKEECISIFNDMIRGTPVSFQEKLLPMVSEYLTENNIENSEKMVNLIVQNPQLIHRTLPEVVDYYCRKFNILSIRKILNNNVINNFKTILYYE